MSRPRNILVWAALGATLIVPFAFAASSPYLAWRGPAYIIAGFAGVIAMGLLLVQPLLIGGYLPGIPGSKGRRIHRWVGASLIAAVIIHVVGLWITSAPDVYDALLFRSPTPFSDFGVIAMWAVFAAGLLAVIRRRLRLRPRTWLLAHSALVTVVVICSVVHALLIEGTMETITKAALCGLTAVALAKVLIDLRIWKSLKPARKP